MNLFLYTNTCETFKRTYSLSPTQTFPVSFKENIISTLKYTLPTLEKVKRFTKATLMIITRLGKKNNKSSILANSPVEYQLKLEKKFHLKNGILQEESDERGEKKLNPISACTKSRMNLCFVI